MVTLVFIVRKILLLMSLESVSFEPQHFAVGPHSRAKSCQVQFQAAQELLLQITQL